MDRRWEGAGARRTERVVVASGLAAATVAAVVLVVGWFLDVEALRSVVPGLSTMKANTAVGFVLIGGGLPLVVTRQWQRAGVVLAAGAALLGALTALQYVAGTDLGIDQLLIADPVTSAPDPPGRMGLNTSVCFTGLGVATALLAMPRGRQRLIAQVLAGLVGGLAGVATLAYALEVAVSGVVASATSMAVHTAVLFVVLAAAVAAATADVGVLAVLTLDERAGRVARRVVPAVVGVQFVVLALVELAARAGAVPDEALQLALVWSGGVLVSTLVVLLSLSRTARTERLAAAVARDREALLAAFTGLHLRIGPHGEVRSVHGTMQDHHLWRSSAPPRLEDIGGPQGEVVRDVADTARAHGRGFASYELGNQQAFEVRAVALADGEVAVSVGDVSALVQAQRELTALNDHLEDEVVRRTADLAASNRELERFAYLASHDLQEPLRMVTGFVGKIAARYGDQLDERGQRYLEFAVDGAERMSGLIEGLLAYSRAGRIDPARVAQVSLAAVVADAAAVTDLTVDDTVADLRIEIDDAQITVEPTLLRQVVQNLIGNAVKFRRSGTVPVVTVVGRRTADTLTIVVEDDGVGIAADQRQDVFAMFRRVSVDPAHRGTGIGLSLVQQIVHAHGGTVEVAAREVGPGTRLVVTMPADGSGVIGDPTRHTALDGVAADASTIRSGGVT